MTFTMLQLILNWLKKWIFYSYKRIHTTVSFNKSDFINNFNPEKYDIKTLAKFISICSENDIEKLINQHNLSNQKVIHLIIDDLVLFDKLKIIEMIFKKYPNIETNRSRSAGFSLLGYLIDEKAFKDFCFNFREYNESTFMISTINSHRFRKYINKLSNFKNMYFHEDILILIFNCTRFGYLGYVKYVVKKTNIQNYHNVILLISTRNKHYNNLKYAFKKNSNLFCLNTRLLSFIWSFGTESMMKLVIRKGVMEYNNMKPSPTINEFMDGYNCLSITDNKNYTRIMNMLNNRKKITKKYKEYIV